MSKTFAIVKPDAMAKGVAFGAIMNRIHLEGFNVLEMRQVNLSRGEAERFYHEHNERPFYGDLCSFMSSGPCVVMVLERDDAVNHWRKVIGATNPKEADSESIRAQWGDSIDNNAVHGSDSDENALKEIDFFFKEV